MNFNAVNFLNDYNISISDSGKNTQRGWINIQCPFCGDDINHGGINLKNNYYNCWRCGWHPLPELISNLIDCSIKEAKRIMLYYSKKSRNIKKEKENKKAQFIKFPEGSGELKKAHRDYLVQRNFDPDKLIKGYSLKGTGHIGNYKFRIIAPIYFNGKMVSYQGRDITNKSPVRYKACSKQKEIIHHKNILYNFDNAVSYKKCVLVEGITDVWRLGPGAIGTFGTSVTAPQKLLLKEFEQVYILYDNEEEAIKKAKMLSTELQSLGVDVYVINYDGANDPSELSQDDANYFMGDIMK